MKDQNTLKCPCCNNPWAAATGDLFAKLCAECSTSDNDPTKPTSLRKYLDESVSPKDDFYHYANGTWMKENPIPSGYPSWNTFLVLHTQSQERLKDLLLSKVDNSEGEGDLNEKKVSAFYDAAMDEEKIEEIGLEPLDDLFALCDKAGEEMEASNLEGVAACLGDLVSRFGIWSFFSIGKYLLFTFTLHYSLISM